MKKKKKSSRVGRRAFLKNTSLAAFMAMMGGVELTAPGCRRSQPFRTGAMMGSLQGAPPAAAASQSAGGAQPLTVLPPVPAVNYGVIGAGVWGRKIITTLATNLKNDPQFKNTEV